MTLGTGSMFFLAIGGSITGAILIYMAYQMATRKSTWKDDDSISNYWGKK